MGARLFSPPPLSKTVSWIVDKGSDLLENGRSRSGSPTSPLLANLWLILFEFPSKDSELELLRRYVDVILCVRKKNELNLKLSEIIELHSNLKLTYELGLSDVKISF